MHRRPTTTAALTAAVLVLTSATAFAQVPGGPGSVAPVTPPPPPPPIAIPAPPDPPAPTPQPPVSAGELPPNLTRVYAGDDGGALYLRAEGTTVVGFAEHPGRKYAFAFKGTRNKNVVDGSWYDVAKGTRTTSGNIKLKIFQKGDKLVRSAGSDFGPDVFRVVDPAKVKWPGAREAGFQASQRSDLDGAFIGKTSAHEPDGSRQYWRESSFGAIGVAEGVPAKGSKRPSWVSVFFGKRDASGDIVGDYFDVPKGTQTQQGKFVMVAQRFGRNYAFALNDYKLGPATGRSSQIEADYALDLDELAAEVDKELRGNVVGFGYAISSNGKVVRSDGGGRSYISETNKGFDIDLPFTEATQSDIASSTKLVTATAVMRELDKRGMSVDSQAGSYLPSCWDLGPGMQTVTFRRLLDMSSGIFRPNKATSLKQDPTGYLFQRGAAEGGLTGTKGYENMNYAMLGWAMAGLLDGDKVEASHAKHGCGAGTKAFDESLGIFRDYVLDMLNAQGILGGWTYRSSLRAKNYDFANQNVPGAWPTTNINPTGGLKISAKELGEFLADLEHGRFVKRSTVRVMKDGELGFDDLTSQGGPANAFLARDGLGLADKKNGGCGSDDKGRGCGSQTVMLPGDVQIAVIFNSRNNQTRKDSNGNFISVATLLRWAWQNAIR